MMEELAKLVGVLAWATGLLLLLFAPVVGLMVLVVALLLTLWVRARTQERRHQELLHR